MRIYKPLSDSNRLRLLKTKSELDIQVPLCAQLIADGFVIRSGMTTAVKGSLNRKGSVALDLVVFKGKKALAIIEVKREDEGHRIALDQTEQGMKYRHFGVPVILFWDVSRYEDLLKFLKSTRDCESESGDDLRIESAKKETTLVYLRTLRRRLDTASMAAFDARIYFPRAGQIETILEGFRNEIDEAYKTI